MVWKTRKEGVEVDVVDDGYDWCREPSEERGSHVERVPREYLVRVDWDEIPRVERCL